jgi:hypothetical protein
MSDTALLQPITYTKILFEMLEHRQPRQTPGLAPRDLLMADELRFVLSRLEQVFAVG